MAGRLKRYVVGNLPAFLQPWWAKLEASPLGYRLARGTFWSLAGALISRGLWLFASILVARMLGKTGFGELGIIQSTLGMFGVFAGLGMGVTANKHVAELRLRDPVRTGRIIALSSAAAWCSGLLMAGVIIIFAPWLASRTLAAPQLGPLLRTGSVLLALGAVNGAQTGVLSGFEAFKRIAAINFYAGLASFPLLLGGVRWWGLAGAVWALIGSQALNSWLSFLAIRREAAIVGVPLGFVGCAQESRVLWGFSLPAVFCGALGGPISWVCNTLLVNQPTGYAEMGVLNAANQWFTALLFLPTVLGQAVLSMLSERLGNNDTVRSTRVLSFSIRLNAIAVFPLVAVGSLLSPYIMASYGRGFGGSWLTLCFVLVTAAVLAVQVPVGQIIVAAGRMWLGALMNLGWGMCFIALTWAFLSWGALGLACARLIAYLLHATWTFLFAFHLIRSGGRPSQASEFVADRDNLGRADTTNAH